MAKVRTWVAPDEEVARKKVQQARRVIDGRERAKAKPAWVPPTMHDLSAGHVLAFDQGAFKTGWCHFRLSFLQGVTPEFKVLGHGRLLQPTVPGLNGFEDTLKRAEWMGEVIKNLVGERVRHPYCAHSPLYIVWEMPAFQG